MTILTKILLTAAIYCHGVSSLQCQEADYFPMHIGDKWLYEHRAGGVHGIHWANRVVEVTDTTTINRRTYFVFEDRLYDLYYEPGRIYQRTDYYRKPSNGDVMKYDSLTNEEQLYYTFQRDSLLRPYLYCCELNTPEQKWQITFIDINATVMIPLGVFLHCYEYRFEVWTDGHVLPLEVRSLAPNVGLIRVGAEGDLNYLVGAYINGLFIGDTTTTSIHQTTPRNIPSMPHLSQNYPNPFSHTTRIRYSIPSFWTEPIQISIFNMLGREIITFTASELIKTNYEMQWNGADKFGKKVSNGTYMIRLRSGRFNQFIKLIFLDKEAER